MMWRNVLGVLFLRELLDFLRLSGDRCDKLPSESGLLPFLTNRHQNSNIMTITKDFLHQVTTDDQVTKTVMVSMASFTWVSNTVFSVCKGSNLWPAHSFPVLTVLISSKWCLHAWKSLLGKSIHVHLLLIKFYSVQFTPLTNWVIGGNEGWFSRDSNYSSVYTTF